MSPFDASAFETRDEQAYAAAAMLEQLSESGEVSREALTALISAATRLYSSASARAGEELPPLEDSVSTTDALTLCCALLRSQDLTPFDMAVWFSRGQRPN